MPEVPAVPEQPSAPRPAAAGAEPWPLRALVVENDASSRELLARVLRLHGCAADTAIGAGQGLALLQRNRYDLLVTDLRMEPTDGVEMLRELGKLDRATWPRACVVLSGYLQEYYEKLIALPVPVEPFQKPLHLPSLIAILDRLRGQGAQKKTG